jgi:hypothetical protein
VQLAVQITQDGIDIGQSKINCGVERHAVPPGSVFSFYSTVYCGIRLEAIVLTSL